MITVNKGEVKLDGYENTIMAEYLTLTSLIFNDLDLGNFEIDYLKETINMIMDNKNSNEIKKHYANKEFNNLRDELGIRRIEDE